jgi:DNA-directed RNA polymerase specialized sigma24 family protein
MLGGRADPHDVTLLLSALTQGDEEAGEKLIPLVYVELRRLAQGYMRRERTDHTLQATALVHEAYLKLVEQRSANWQSRAHRRNWHGSRDSTGSAVLRRGKRAGS